MMGKVFHDWNIARALWLALAVAFLGAAIAGGEWITYAFAGIFGLQAFFNVGCCGAACVPRSKNPMADPLVQEVTYEEIK
jgi:hypothetical protein